MSWAVVKGKYKQGIIKPLEELPYRQGEEALVLILFPENIEQRGKNETWQRIKQEIAKLSPDLINMTLDEKQADFEYLSEQIIEDMPYQSVEEFERAMRGDMYGLVGY